MVLIITLNSKLSTFHYILCPELTFLIFLHPAAAARAGAVVPYRDALAAAMQAQPSHLAAERRSDIAYHSTHNNVLNGVTVGTTDGSDVLPEKSFTFVCFSLVATVGAAVFQFPSHFI